MMRFVLIHGASHGGWCWRRIAEALQAQGHEAVAPDLPGRGNDGIAFGEISLGSYVDAVTASLDAGKGTSVLVGHSMGGFAVAGAAEARPEKVQALVYLTAYAPLDGDSVGSILADDPSSKVPAVTELVEEGLAVQIAEASLVPIFYNDCTKEDAADAVSRLVPEPAIPLGTPLALGGGRSAGLPKYYIGCLRDECISLEYQRKLADRAGATWAGALDAGHSPFLSKPTELTELLVRVASETMTDSATAAFAGNAQAV